MRVLVLFATLALSTATALAQPGMTPPSPQPYGPPPPAMMAPQPAVAAVPRAPLKDEATARWAAIGATALGAAMFYAGIERNSEEVGITGIALTIVGPSMGHVYAGETGRAVKMSLLRAAGFGLFVYGADTAWQSRCIDYCGDDYGDPEDGETAMALGAAVFIGATLYDIYDAPRAARRTNAKQAAQWQVAPTAMSSQGRTLPAVSLSATF